MASQVASEGYEFERTLMHGRYRNELGQYAREVAAAQRQREIEELRQIASQRSKKRARIGRCFDVLKNSVAPYVADWLFILVLGVLMAILSFAIDFVIAQLGRGVSIITSL
jgi:chloride channel 2